MICGLLNAMTIVLPLNVNHFFLGFFCFGVYVLFYVWMLEELGTPGSLASNTLRMSTFLMGFGLMWTTAKAFPGISCARDMNLFCFWKTLVLFVALNAKDVLFPQVVYRTSEERLHTQGGGN